MRREIIATSEAPKAIGPYSQAVKAGGLVFTSGQIALDPETGAIAGLDIQTQTRRVLNNLKAVLESAGSSMGLVVKTTVYLKNMGDFAAMNSVYGEYFPGEPPARSTVEVARLPKDVLVEIEAVALVQPDGP